MAGSFFNCLPRRYTGTAEIPVYAACGITIEHCIDKFTLRGRSHCEKSLNYGLFFGFEGELINATTCKYLGCTRLWLYLENDNNCN